MNIYEAILASMGLHPTRITGVSVSLVRSTPELGRIRFEEVWPEQFRLATYD